VKYSYSCQEFTKVIVNTRPADASSIEPFEIAGKRVSDTDMNHNSDSVILMANVRKLENESTVSAAKKKDLIWMCNELIIPRDYHQFYNDLAVISSEERSTEASDTGTAAVVEANVCSVPDAPGVRTRSAIAKPMVKPQQSTVSATVVAPGFTPIGGQRSLTGVLRRARRRGGVECGDGVTVWGAS